MKIYHTRILIFIPILVLLGDDVTSTHAQSFWNDLSISVEFAAAQHDGRTPSTSIRLSGDSEDRWGTYQYGISIRKHVLDWKSIGFEVGLGYSLEHLTYLRPFDHCFHLPGDICTEVGVYTNDYKIHTAQLPIETTFQLSTNTYAVLSILPLFDIYKKVKTPSGNIRGEKMNLDFYSLEVNPGIAFQWDRIGIGLFYRLYQIKKVDRVIFFSSNDKLEDYNPLKFWFSVGYRVGNAE